MKKNSIFVITNALLIVVVGVVVGLTCENHIFSNSVGISAFICFLISLGLPSALFLLNKSITTGGKICTSLFIIFELIFNIVFMINPNFGLKPFWIIQAIIISIFLVAILIIIGLFKDDKKCN